MGSDSALEAVLSTASALSQCMFLLVCPDSVCAQHAWLKSRGAALPGNVLFGQDITFTIADVLEHRGGWSYALLGAEHELAALRVNNENFSVVDLTDLINAPL